MFKLVNYKKYIKYLDKAEIPELFLNELKKFGFKDLNGYKKSLNKFDRFAIVFIDRKPIVFMSLNRCNELTFFINSKATKKQKLKSLFILKRKIEHFANKYDYIIVKTPTLFNNKILKVFKFKKNVVTNLYIEWVRYGKFYENNYKCNII